MNTSLANKYVTQFIDPAPSCAFATHYTDFLGNKGAGKEKRRRRMEKRESRREWKGFQKQGSNVSGEEHCMGVRVEYAQTGKFLNH